MTCLSLLIYLHIVFNQQPISCLSHLHETWPRHGVLRLELFLQTPPENYDIRRSYAREYQYDYLQTHPNVSEALPSNLSVNTSAENVFEQNRTALIVQPTESNEQESFVTSWLNSLFDVDWFHELLLDEQPILEYSLEYGFLRLSPATRQRLNISVLLVKLGKILSVRTIEMRCFVPLRLVRSQQQHVFWFWFESFSTRSIHWLSRSSDVQRETTRRERSSQGLRAQCPDQRSLSFRQRRTEPPMVDVSRCSLCHGDLRTSEPLFLFRFDAILCRLLVSPCSFAIPISKSSCSSVSDVVFRRANSTCESF